MLLVTISAILIEGRLQTSLLTSRSQKTGLMFLNSGGGVSGSRYGLLGRVTTGPIPGIVCSGSEGWLIPPCSSYSVHPASSHDYCGHRLSRPSMLCIWVVSDERCTILRCRSPRIRCPTDLRPQDLNSNHRNSGGAIEPSRRVVVLHTKED